MNGLVRGSAGLVEVAGSRRDKPGNCANGCNSHFPLPTVREDFSLATNKSPFPRGPEKRTPVPHAPMPQAGESLRETALNLFFDRFFVYFMMGATLAGVAAVEWLMVAMKEPLSPWFWTCFAIPLCTLAAWRWFRIKPQLTSLWQGIRGERDVARTLEQLRAVGYSVFHDISGEGFNVDHALVGPGGIFAIETKTLSKPVGRKATVEYDGKRVLVDGMALDHDPITQVEAGADHLRGILKSMTARELTVRPVVLFPGWWVNPQPRGCRTWVLNPKSLGAFLANEPTRLSPEDVALFNDRLTLSLSIKAGAS